MNDIKLEFDMSQEKLGAFEVIKQNETDSKLYNRMIALGNSLVSMCIPWTMNERKIFMAAVSQLKWSENGNEFEIELDKRELHKILGSPKVNSISLYLRNECKKLAKDSYIQWTDPEISDEDEEEEIFQDGFLIKGFHSTKKNIYIHLNEDYRGVLEGLKKNFTMLWSNDMYKFQSAHTAALYQDLLRLRNLHTKAGFSILRYTTKQLKTLFGLSKDDYMREKYGFNRSEFEKKVLNKAVDEINNKSNMVRGLKYIKVKGIGNYIEYYEFKYFVADQVTENKQI